MRKDMLQYNQILREVIPLQHLYIDESGSMTSEYTDQWPFFTIAIVAADNKEKAKRVVKRFVSKNMDALRVMDTDGKMFLDGNFHELKGTCMSRDMQVEFIHYMCRNGLIKVFLIRVDNKKIKYGLYANTARAFNYILGQALYNLLKEGMLPKDSYMLHIDERNQKTGTTHYLEDYLNIKLGMEHELTDEIFVKYYDSAQNSLIQAADVFSNAYYKCCKGGRNNQELGEVLRSHARDGYILARYHFPEKIIKIT